MHPSMPSQKRKLLPTSHLPEITSSPVAPVRDDEPDRPQPGHDRPEQHPPLDFRKPRADKEAIGTRQDSGARERNRQRLALDLLLQLVEPPDVPHRHDDYDC